MKSTVSLSIIILNYNRYTDTVFLIQSLQQQILKKLEIIVVDNNSIDNSLDKLRRKFSNITIINSKKNIGRAAHNLGAKAATGNILVFLDADLYFTDKQFMKRLAEKFSNLNIDAVSFYMKDPTGKTYGWEPSYSIKGDEKKGFPSTFGGGMWAIRKDIFDKVGGFNKDFFVYVDEWEYLLRLWEHGFEVRYFPDLTGYHKESPYAYRSIMKGYHVIVNHAQLLALYVPVTYWFRFFKHYMNQTSTILATGEANRQGTVKGIFLVLLFFLKSFPKRKTVSQKTMKKFISFYFPEKNNIVVGKYGWVIPKPT